MNSNTFVGANIVQAVTREFWLRGELVTPCCVTYFVTSEDKNWKLSYNDETCRWVLAVSNDMPEVGIAEGDEEFLYPIVDLSCSSSIVGLAVSDYEESDLGDHARARLIFSDGSELHFAHWYDSDKEGFNYQGIA